ncbi:MAG: hypothetical protein ACOYNC_07940 [Bacteroidales bacterium]
MEEKTHIKILNSATLFMIIASLMLLLGILPKYLPVTKELQLRAFSLPPGSIQLFLSVGLFIPIIEELIFRLPLQYSNTNIVISLSFSIAMIFSEIYKFQFLKPYTSIQIFASALLVILVLGFVFQKYLILPEVFQSLYNKFNIPVFYLFVFAFAILHTVNIKNLTLSLLPVASCYIGQKLLMSFSLSYLRIKYGLIYSIAMHCLNNSIALLVIRAFL